MLNKNFPFALILILIIPKIKLSTFAVDFFGIFHQILRADIFAGENEGNERMSHKVAVNNGMGC